MSEVPENLFLSFPDSKARPVFGPARNRVTDSALTESGRKSVVNNNQQAKSTKSMAGCVAQYRRKNVLKKDQDTKSAPNCLTESFVCFNGSLDASCSSGASSDSSCGVTTVKTTSQVKFRARKKQNGVKSEKIVPDGVEVSAPLLAKRRCAWITSHSDPIYISFHDEEWGVPVHNDKKLFELLVLSGALAELSWPTILNKRSTFRELFANFDPATISEFSEKKILSLKAYGNALLSEPKLRAVVENARPLLEVAEEFGSFSNYCWSFVNHKPVVNGFRYPRQVPVKTAKAEAMSKDMIRRGFRCVGPTVVYSFMQASGFVNDHLSSCFRYRECGLNSNDSKSKVEEKEKLVKKVEELCSRA